MVLQGTARTVSGVVADVALEARPEWGQNGEVPFKVRCQLALSDGTPLYLDTSAGTFGAQGFRPAQVAPAGPDGPGGYPWAIPGPVDAQGVEGDPVLTVW